MSRLGGTILVVDDHVALAENLAEILGNVGYQTAWTDSAESALDAVERGVASPLSSPTTACPVLNGAQLIAEMRRRGIDIPAVVMSAHTDPETIGIAETAGALEVFPKPVDMSHLMRMVEALDRGETAVLVVEDNRSLAENLAEALRGAGHQVIIGTSGADALSHRTRPGIAIVDYRLPDGSGHRGRGAPDRARSPDPNHVRLGPRRRAWARAWKAAAGAALGRAPHGQASRRLSVAGLGRERGLP